MKGTSCSNIFTKQNLIPEYEKEKIRSHYFAYSYYFQVHVDKDYEFDCFQNYLSTVPLESSLQFPVRVPPIVVKY